MKYFVLFLLILSVRSYADHPKLNHCNTTDARCVGTVLLESIERSVAYVEFYWDDNCKKDFLALVRMGDRQACKDKAPFIYREVHGVKINGTCINIQDKNFYSACMSVI